MSTSPWTDTLRCPFCGDRLSDPGRGFIDHIDTSGTCRDAFETWRTTVGDDMGGTWSG